MTGGGQTKGGRGHLTPPFISAQELAGMLGTAGVKIFDVRGTWMDPPRALPQDYHDAHIPGAVFLDWTAEFIEVGVDLGLASVSDAAAAAQSFARLGINHGDQVILYDDKAHIFAGRIWWAMRYFGFDTVRVLEGGLPYWVAQNLPVSTQIPNITAGSFVPRVVSDLRVDLPELIDALGHDCVVDARGAESFAGNAHDPRSGHILGTRNLPFKSLLDADTGLFLAADKLAAVMDQSIPGWADSRVIASCGAGYSATVVMLAMARLGVSAALFDGSFALWKLDPARAVAQAR